MCASIDDRWNRVGDVLAFMLALMVIRTAKQVEGGLPSWLLLRMYCVALLDFGIGFVPFIGDAADAVFKANNRNTVALEAYLREKGKKNLRNSGLPIPDVDPSDPADYDRLNASSRPENTSQQPSQQEPMMSAGRTQNNQPQESRGGTSGGAQRPPEPPQARVHADGRGGSSGGLFGIFGKKTRPADVESGIADNGPSVRQTERH